MAKGKGTKQQTTAVITPKKTVNNTSKAPVKKPTNGTSKEPVKKVSTGPQSLATYLIKVSKATNNDVGLRKNLKEYLEQVSTSFIRLVGERAQENLKGRNTILERDVEYALRAFVPESDVRERILERGNKVLEKYNTTKKVENVNMSLPRTRAWLVNGLTDLRVAKKAEIYLATVLDQLIAELTKEANVYSAKAERNNITLPDFNRAVKKTAWMKGVLDVLNVKAVDGNGDDE